MVAYEPQAKKAAYLCVRPETGNPDLVCFDCSNFLYHVVLKEEHDQSDYYFCPVSNIGAYETLDSLKTVCPDCNLERKGSHTPGPKDNGCPSRAGFRGERPEKFPARMPYGNVEYWDIVYEKPDWELTRETISKLDQWYQRMCSVSIADKVKAIKSIVPSMVAVFTSPSAKDQIHELIPWSIGECLEVTAKRYTMLLYKFKANKVKANKVKANQNQSFSIWNARVEPGERKIEIPVSSAVIACPLTLEKQGKKRRKKERKNNLGLIPVETIFAVSEDERFKWDINVRLELKNTPELSSEENLNPNPESVPEEPELEELGDLDGDEDEDEAAEEDEDGDAEDGDAEEDADDTMEN